MTKKIITKKKFLELNFRSANKMSKDKKLFKNKINVLSMQINIVGFIKVHG